MNKYLVEVHIIGYITIEAETKNQAEKELRNWDPYPIFCEMDIDGTEVWGSTLIEGKEPVDGTDSDD